MSRNFSEIPWVPSFDPPKKPWPPGHPTLPKLPRSRLSAAGSIWAPRGSLWQSGTSDTTTVLAKSPAPTKPPSHRLTSPLEQDGMIKL